jgi:enoyl-CoA hydratase
METQNVIIDKKNGIALLTINRPTALNSLNRSVLDSLLKALTDMSQDEEVKVIILTGSGNKSFVAGGDIREMSTLTVQQAIAFARQGQHLMHYISQIAKPVIAAVNGYALGGGLELALACDFIYASENARLGLPEVTLGIIPGFGGTQKLGRIIGRSRAHELIYTGKSLTATEAKEWGLVNAVFPADELLERVVDTAHTIASNGLIGVAHAKEAVRIGLDMSEADGMSYEVVLFASLFATADQKEGMQAFIDKKKPVFSGS